jgi:hypothetical protein
VLSWAEVHRFARIAAFALALAGFGCSSGPADRSTTPAEPAQDHERAGGIPEPPWLIDLSTLTVSMQEQKLCATMSYSDGALFAEGCFEAIEGGLSTRPDGVGHLYYPNGARMATIEDDGGGHSVFWGITEYWLIDGRRLAEIRPRTDTGADPELLHKFPDVEFADWLQRADGFRPCPDDQAMFLRGPHWSGLEADLHSQLISPFEIVCYEPFNDYFRAHLQLSPFGEVRDPDVEMSYFELGGDAPPIPVKAREARSQE